MGDSQLNVRLDGCHPYPTLPKRTCDALAADLPVVYRPALGLYIWDTGSPAWPRIAASASALTFTFLDPDNNARRLNVSVPFAHLNLTLEPPLVERPTPYFPCNAVAAGAHYALGRAFLQDAFFAASFDSATYFLSQAPGPNIAAVGAANANTAVIGRTARTLAASNNDWKTSWEGIWTPLPGGDGEESDPTTKASPGVGESNGIANDSTGVQRNAGLIAGIGGGVSLLALVAFLLYRRNRHGTGLTCCGLRSVKDKEPAGRYGPATKPGSPSPQLDGEQEAEEEEGYKYPNYYNRHELPLTEPPSQLPDNQVARPLTGLAAAAMPGESVGVPKEAQPQGQVFEMGGGLVS
ncbi:hypothetical protein PG985_013191 [Apiospora marii]|uniref:uncharacterized protein n=1 Tax=Apiospora marii TaxID=335849 RepID=UPI00312DF52F